jgi:hypothetical protein
METNCNYDAICYLLKIILTISWENNIWFIDDIWNVVDNE